MEVQQMYQLLRRVKKLSQKMLCFIILSKLMLRKSCVVFHIVQKHATGKYNPQVIASIRIHFDFYHTSLLYDFSKLLSRSL